MTHPITWQTRVLNSDLPPTARLILLVIKSYMDRNGEGAVVSYSSICKDTGLTRAAVAAHLMECEKFGWLKIQRSTAPDGGRAANAYFTSVPSRG